MQREHRRIRIAPGPGLRVRITVRGRLSERLAAAFEGMTTVSCEGATDLVGEVTDQAHLHALLTQIRDLGLELESINRLPVETPPASRADQPKEA